MILDKEQLRKNLDEVIWNIEQARISVSEHHIVQLVGVGKYTELENIATLYELGQRAFGENQVQQLSQRMESLDELPLQWHMIGTLQKNKKTQQKSVTFQSVIKKFGYPSKNFLQCQKASARLNASERRTPKQTAKHQVTVSI